MNDRKPAQQDDADSLDPLAEGEPVSLDRAATGGRREP